VRIFVCDEMLRNIQINLGKIKSAIRNANDNDYEAYYIYSFALTVMKPTNLLG